MDEPLSVLDAALRNALRAELVHLQKTLRVTTVFVTHDQFGAMTVGDVIVVNEGKVEQVGSPDEIYNRPHTRFVAGFVGTPAMNFIEGAVEDSKGSLFPNTQRSRFSVRERMRSRLGNRGTNHWLGIRPQHMRILDAPSEGSTAGEVWAVERTARKMSRSFKRRTGARCES
jgi:multiple sugar transport system ATP-binding protein